MLLTTRYNWKDWREAVSYIMRVKRVQMKRTILTKNPIDHIEYCCDL